METSLPHCEKETEMNTYSQEINFISSSAIKPASTNLSTEARRVELTKWDLQMLPYLYMQRGLLFTTTTKPSKQEEDDMIFKLKNSLSKTLDHFFPLAGRLVVTEHKDDGSISLHIDCNSAGAEFIHASANVTVADLLNPTYVPSIVCSFFPLNGVVNQEGRSQPLLSVQVTQLIDGIFIGCSMNHSVCDGITFWHFLNSWSKISKSSSIETSIQFPTIQPCFLNDTHCPIRLPLSYDELLTLKYIPPPLLVERIFHFEPHNVARLKAKANLETEMKGEGRRISSLQALFGHFWVAVVRAKNLDLTENTKFAIPMGNRARLNPPLPETYFGNSVDLRIASCKVEDLLERGLNWGASVLNEIIMSHNDASIRCSWDSWVEEPSYFGPNTCVTPTITLRSGGSLNFNLYGNDFGWGRPIAVRSGLVCKYSGKIIASPGRIKGSVDIEVCFPQEVLEAMADDSEFMDFVTD